MVAQNNTHWAHMGPTCLVLGCFLFSLPRTTQIGPMCGPHVLLLDVFYSVGTEQHIWPMLSPYRLLFLVDFYSDCPEQHIYGPCGPDMCCSGMISIRTAHNNTWRALVGPTCFVLGCFLFRLHAENNTYRAHVGPICVVHGWIFIQVAQNNIYIWDLCVADMCCTGMIFIQIAQN